MNYYNENDPFAAEWLRQLISQGHIPEGIVDERDIQDVAPSELEGFTQCHFFAGIGGWSYALRLAGWPDSKPVWTGSCPCQPFSQAGKGKGTADERHLWPAFHHLISIQRPGVVFGEQVASKDGLAWLDLVQADLEGTGYASAAVDICAAGIGAQHIRQRIWFVAERLGEPHSAGPQQGNKTSSPTGHRNTIEPTSGPAGSAGPTNGFWRDVDWLQCRDEKWRPVEPGTFPLAHGIPNRVGKLRGYGNAIVPQVAQAFIAAYNQALRKP